MTSMTPFNPTTSWPTYTDPFSDVMMPYGTVNEHPSRLMNTTRGAISKFRPILHTDIIETANDFHVHCDLPGVLAADLECTVLPDVLIIKAEKKFANREESDTWCHSERAYGKVQRTLPLPKGANHDGAVAKFEHGVLTVSFPKVKGGSSDAGRKLAIKVNIILSS